MFSTVPVIQPTSSHPPDVMEVLSSMCHATSVGPSQPIVRWILEEGQLLGVLVAETPLSWDSNGLSCG